MNRLSVACTLGAAVFVWCCLSAAIDASEPVTALGEPAGPWKPLAAPNSASIAISRSGSTAVLDWEHPDPTLTGYEVWRSEDPYFQPQSVLAVMVGSFSFSEGIYSEFAAFSFSDDGVCGSFIAAGQLLPCAPQGLPVAAIGDPAHQYFWIVRAKTDDYADSNRAGEFDFPLVRAG